MKALVYLFSIALWLFTFGASSQIFGQSAAAFTDGKAADLSAVQIKKLSLLNAAIAVPTHLPSGFKLKKLEIPPTDAAWIIDYKLIYTDTAGKTFVLQSSNDGIGDIEYENGVKGKNRYFDGLIEAGKDEGGRTIVNWVASLKKYHPSGAQRPQFYSLIAEAKSLTREEAVKIMNSLRYLKLPN